MINEVNNFIGSFLNNEFDLIKSIALEPDRNVVHKKYEEFLKYFIKGALKDSSIVLNESIDKRWKTEGNEWIKGLCKRTLFQIKEYEYPELGSIFRCYLSNLIEPYQNNYKYFYNYFIIKKDNDYKIFSIYIFKKKNEDINRKLSLDLKDFNNVSGVELKKISLPPKNILKVFPPTFPPHLEEYNKE